MLLLSNQTYEKLTREKFSSKIQTKTYEVIHYFDKGEKILYDLGLLNFIICQDGKFYGLKITELENSRVAISNQEKMSKLNASAIIGVTVTDEELLLSHWDGFITTLNVGKNFLVAKQEFSK